MNSHFGTFAVDVDNLDGADDELDDVQDIIVSALRGRGYKSTVTVTTYRAYGEQPTEATPVEAEPIPARWDGTVVHPNPDNPRDTETLVGCIADDGTGRPIGLLIDDDKREALGLALVDPHPEN
ncbi:hypothetical protein AB0D90_03610 [Streptomyces althioticus]|uniref:Uncharacterized protein n=1 Tax=Streptomyces cellulosae TaxID=1968 RepID=A0ABW6JIP9_STRCE